MEMVWFVIIAVGAVVALVGFVMFTIATFRQSILWGLGALLVPLVSLAFLATHWNEGKKGFALNLAGFALVVLAMLPLTEQMQREQEAMAASESAAAQAGMGFDSSDSDRFSQNGQWEPEPAASAEKVVLRPEPKRVRYAFLPAEVSDITGKSRSRVEIVTSNGKVHSGELTGADSRRVEIRKRMNGGSIDYGVNVRDIEQIRVWGPVQS